MPVNVKVVTFKNGLPDFIFSEGSYKKEGSLKGLIKSGTFALIDVKKVITGTMCPIEFEKLEPWEG